MIVDLTNPETLVALGIIGGTLVAWLAYSVWAAVAEWWAQ